jgi:ribonuclease R
MSIGHFALASEHYCHFTSPIRRYPDLTIHRMVEAYCRGKLKDLPPDDVPGLVELGQHCSSTDREAEAASNELRDVLVLQFLETRLGETFDGVITGVTNFGIFVQSQRFLIEGLVRLEDLGDDWWEIDGKRGLVRGEVTGRTYRLGDVMPVRIAAVDVAQRQLKLVPERQLSARAGKKGGKKKGGRKGSRGKGGKMKVAAKKGNTEQRRKITKGKSADKSKAKRRRKTAKKSGSGGQEKSSAKRSAKKSSGKKQSGKKQSGKVSGKQSGGKKSGKKKSTRKAPASGSRKRRTGKNR